MKRNGHHVSIHQPERCCTENAVEMKSSSFYQFNLQEYLRGFPKEGIIMLQ